MRVRRAAVAVLAALVPASSAAAVERVSVSSRQVQANASGAWWYLAPQVAVSGDGSRVAFSSDATNLVRGDANGSSDVFVRDRERRATSLVSVGPRGVQADGPSFGVALSAEGDVVAFHSRASNLVRGDTNDAADIFVRDRRRNTTRRVSVGPRGRQANGGSGFQPVLSADGRFVAFTSEASNLVRDDSNGEPDVFVHDRRTGRTSRVSVGPAGRQGDGWSTVGDLSPDGRFVAFASQAMSFGLGGDPDRSDVFLRDRLGDTTIRIGDSGWDSLEPARMGVSADGGVVSFDQHGPQSGVVVWERATGAVTCVACWNGIPPATWDAFVGMSDDGRRIAFVSLASTIVPADTNGAADVFVHDGRTGGAQRVSVGPAGAQADAGSGVGGMSADGRFVAFLSDATNLARGDTNRRTDVFVHGPLAP